MKKALVNRIYWAPDHSNAFTLGASGSQLIVKPNGEIHQHNDLMAPGDAIMFWHSHEDYQTSKAVPQLPILTPGVKYRMVIHGSSFPNRTVLYRVGFFDLQGHEISNKYFRDQISTFVFPKDAVNYEIKVVNAGATDFYFKNIEISASWVENEANSNFWVQQPIGNEDNPLLILLIHAGNRTKENYPELEHYCAWGYYLLPIVAENEDEEKTEKKIASFLKEQELNAINIVGCDLHFNEIIVKLATQFPQCQFLTINQRITAGSYQNIANYELKSNIPWIAKENFKPDWATIFKAIKQNWGGQLNA